MRFGREFHDPGCGLPERRLGRRRADAGDPAGHARDRAGMGLAATPAPAMTGRRRAGAAICLSLLAAAGGVAWASVRSDGAAAAGLRGDAVWASGSRPAPAFALTDQSGHRVSPASLP